MSLLYSSTCFEHNRAHHRESGNCIVQHLASKRSAGGRPMQPMHWMAACRVMMMMMMPDAVQYNFDPPDDEHGCVRNM